MIRSHSSSEMLAIDDMNIVLLALSLEGVRYLTEHFIAATNEFRMRNNPPVFAFVDLGRSPVVATLAFYRELLKGEEGRGNGDGGLTIVMSPIDRAMVI